MHFAFATRGAIERVEKLIRELSSQYVPFKKYNSKTKKLEEVRINLRLCPIQLWDLSYPREHRDAILTTLLRNGNGRPVRDKETWRIKLLDKVINFLCKMGGMRPLGEFKRDSAIAMTPPEDTEIIAIGEKDDYWITEDCKHVDYEHKTPLSFEGI